MVGRPSVSKGDPRVAEVLSELFEMGATQEHRTGGGMSGRTHRSDIVAGAAVDHLVEGVDAQVGTRRSEHAVRTTVTAQLATGQELVLTKTLGYAW